MEVINNLTSMFTTNLEIVNNNKILSSVIGLFLILYAALAAPKLPKSITRWFDNMWFKLGFMFLIAYTATKDPSVAIISAVALLVTLQTLSAQKTTENVIQSVQAKVKSSGDIVKLIMAESESKVNPETHSEVQPMHANAEVQPSHAEVQPSHAEVQPSHAEVQPSHAEVQPSHAESEYRQNLQENVSDILPNYNTRLDDMSGYEFGELATF